jgi:hypothetical protein
MLQEQVAGIFATIRMEYKERAIQWHLANTNLLAFIIGTTAKKFKLTLMQWSLDISMCGCGQITTRIQLKSSTTMTYLLVRTIATSMLVQVPVICIFHLAREPQLSILLGYLMSIVLDPTGKQEHTTIG